MSSTSSTSPSARTNLPLPTELRIQILEYILLGENARCSGGYPSIQTSLLRVSRGFGKDAHEVLFNRNSFVKVESDCPGLFARLFLLRVPMVQSALPGCDLGRFNEHRVTVCLREASSTPKVPARVREYLGEGCCAIVHANDIGKLVRALRLLNHCQAPESTVLITSGRHSRPLESTMLGHAEGTDDELTKRRTTQPRVVIKANSNSYGTLAHHRLQRLLGPFNGASGIPGIALQDTVTSELVDRSRPPRTFLVWASAMGWDFYDLIRSWKDNIDSILTREARGPEGFNKYEEATCCYRYLRKIVHEAFIAKADLVSKSPDLGWPDALAALSIDVACSLARCKAKNKRSGSAINAIISAYRWQKMLEGRRTLPLVMPLSSLVDMGHLRAILWSELGECRESLDVFDQTIDQAIRWNVPRPQELYQDLFLQRTHVSSSLCLNHRYEVPFTSSLSARRAKCSAHVITLGESSQAILVDDDLARNDALKVTRPEGLSGWIDTQESLSAADLVVLGNLGGENSGYGVT